MIKRLIPALAAGCLLCGCAAAAGHPAGTTTTGPALSHQTAAPQPFKAADLQFADRIFAYVGGALDASGQAKARTSDPQVLQLAAGVRTELQGSKQQLLDWFAQWGKKPPASSSAADRGWRGLPTRAQLHHLAAQQGPAFDRSYLNLIIADQRGVLAAATLEQEGGVSGPARQLADQLVSSSTLTIVHLRQLLKLMT